MVDWWQALLYLLAGGLITVAASYATHYWTTKASRQSEERHAKRRLGEEQRQAIRQLRRERMQPVLDFLDTAKQSVARQPIEKVLDEEYESLGPNDKPPLEQWQEMKSDLFGVVPPGIEEARAFTIAELAAISIPALQGQLLRIYGALKVDSDPKIRAQFGPALRSAERLVEQYLAAAEPHEPTADEPSQET